MPRFSRRESSVAHEVERASTAEIRSPNALVKVVRTLTLPNGNKIRVMRQDALDRAITKARPEDPA